MGADATGRKFDGKRNSVEPAADPGDDRRIGIAQFGAIATRSRALHEKLHGRKFERFGSCQADIVMGTIERIQQVNMLAFDPQRLPAGCQDVRLRCLADNAFGQRRRRVDHVLAIIEHKEDSPLAKKGQQAEDGILSLHHESERRCNRRRHQTGIGQRSEIDEENCALEIIDQRVGNRDCDGCLAHAARADDADEAPRHQLGRQRADGIVAADHSRQPRRQFVAPIADKRPGLRG